MLPPPMRTSQSSKLANSAQQSAPYVCRPFSPRSASPNQARLNRATSLSNLKPQWHAPVPQPTPLGAQPPVACAAQKCPTLALASTPRSQNWMASKVAKNQSTNCQTWKAFPAKSWSCRSVKGPPGRHAGKSAKSAPCRTTASTPSCNLDRPHSQYCDFGSWVGNELL